MGYTIHIMLCIGFYQGAVSLLQQIMCIFHGIYNTYHAMHWFPPRHCVLVTTNHVYISWDILHISCYALFSTKELCPSYNKSYIYFMGYTIYIMLCFVFHQGAVSLLQQIMCIFHGINCIYHAMHGLPPRLCVLVTKCSPEWQASIGSMWFPAYPVYFNRTQRRTHWQTRHYVTQLLSDILHSILSPALQWRHNVHDGISNHQPHHCLFKHSVWCRSTKTSKLHFTGLCAGNSPVTGEFPAQMASNVENV